MRKRLAKKIMVARKRDRGWRELPYWLNRWDKDWIEFITGRRTGVDPKLEKAFRMWQGMVRIRVTTKYGVKHKLWKDRCKSLKTENEDK